jgi:DNA-directed RNA polymerase subunit K/omega
MNVHRATPIGLVAVAAAVLTACQRAEPPEPPESSLEGAWSIVSIRVTGPDSADNTMVQPSVFLFGDRHYSMMRVTGSRARTLAAKDSVTDAEKLATYEVADSTLTIHPIVARSPNFMSGGSDKYVFRVSGDTLWLSNTGADLRTMVGGQLVPLAGTPSATMLVLVRQK